MPARVMEIEHLDARLAGREGGVVLERAGHFALQAACALVRIDVEGLLHDGLSEADKVADYLMKSSA